MCKGLQLQSPLYALCSIGLQCVQRTTATKLCTCNVCEGPQLYHPLQAFHTYNARILKHVVTCNNTLVIFRLVLIQLLLCKIYFKGQVWRSSCGRVLSGTFVTVVLVFVMAGLMHPMVQKGLIISQVTLA